MREWFERFKVWVRNEPVRAAEVVRGFLFSLTAVLAATGVEIEATAVSGVVTALFSIYASQTVRNKVSPVNKADPVEAYPSDKQVDAFEDSVNHSDDVQV